MTETNLRRPARSPNKATAFCHSSAALTSCMLSEKPVAHILSTAQISREYARRDSARQHPTRERGAAASTSQYDTCFSSNHALPSNNCSYCGTNDNAMIGADTTNRLALHDTQSTRTELRNTDSAAVAQKYRQCCCRNGSSPSSSHGATGQDTRKLAAALRLIKSELLRAREYGSKSEYVGAYTTAASTVASRHEQQAVVRAALDYPTKRRRHTYYRGRRLKHQVDLRASAPAPGRPRRREALQKTGGCRKLRKKSMCALLCMPAAIRREREERRKRDSYV
eukprot:CAMPEP_0173119946 /NCGR_PEP_ID=MMETSP1102-20130122/52130_1 /TAXON_ID=49646 /ORGANISM="Geminigera sp., Strain Caron Lab Isolate" /LENGTH=280 /DNA_ID=CAMNT_0014025733 /DNA_START=208 /DNA_END=1050 /DNA_ORIENTATION=+